MAKLGLNVWSDLFEHKKSDRRDRRAGARFENLSQEPTSGAGVDGAARAATFAGGTIDTFFRIDDVVPTTFGRGNRARRTLFSTS